MHHANNSDKALSNFHKRVRCGLQVAAGGGEHMRITSRTQASCVRPVHLTCASLWRLKKARSASCLQGREGGGVQVLDGQCVCIPMPLEACPKVQGPGFQMTSYLSDASQVAIWESDCQLLVSRVKHVPRAGQRHHHVSTAWTEAAFSFDLLRSPQRSNGASTVKFHL